MNVFCYPFHINDFRRDTGHMSHEQKGVYRDLIDAYYHTGGRLPSNLDQLARVIGVQTQSERTALAYAVETFFGSADGVLTHKRCDDELARIKHKSDVASAAAKAKHSKSNVIGRADAQQAHSKRSADAVLTNNQEPIIKVKESPLPPLPDWLSREAWESFISHRKSMKKPLTAKAMELSIKQLDGLRLRGMNPEEVLNQSIANGWTGIFELRFEAGGRRKSSTYSDDLMSAAKGALANTTRETTNEIY